MDFSDITELVQALHDSSKCQCNYVNSDFIDSTPNPGGHRLANLLLNRVSKDTSISPKMLKTHYILLAAKYDPEKCKKSHSEICKVYIKTLNKAYIDTSRVIKLKINKDTKIDGNGKIHIKLNEYNVSVEHTDSLCIYGHPDYVQTWNTVMAKHKDFKDKRSKYKDQGMLYGNSKDKAYVTVYDTGTIHVQGAMGLHYGLTVMIQQIYPSVMDAFKGQVNDTLGRIPIHKRALNMFQDSKQKEAKRANNQISVSQTTERVLDILNETHTHCSNMHSDDTRGLDQGSVNDQAVNSNIEVEACMVTNISESIEKIAKSKNQPNHESWSAGHENAAILTRGIEYPNQCTDKFMNLVINRMGILENEVNRLSKENLTLVSRLKEVEETKLPSLSSYIADLERNSSRFETEHKDSYINLRTSLSTFQKEIEDKVEQMKIDFPINGSGKGKKTGIQNTTQTVSSYESLLKMVTKTQTELNQLKEESKHNLDQAHKEILELTTTVSAVIEDDSAGKCSKLEKEVSKIQAEISEIWKSEERLAEICEEASHIRHPASLQLEHEDEIMPTISKLKKDVDQLMAYTGPKLGSFRKELDELKNKVSSFCSAGRVGPGQQEQLLEESSYLSAAKRNQGQDQPTLSNMSHNRPNSSSRSLTTDKKPFAPEKCVVIEHISNMENFRRDDQVKAGISKTCGRTIIEWISRYDPKNPKIMCQLASVEMANEVKRKWDQTHFEGSSVRSPEKKRVEKPYYGIVKGVPLEVEQSEIQESVEEDFPGASAWRLMKDDKEIRVIKIKFADESSLEKALDQGFFLKSTHLGFQVEKAENRPSVIQCFKCHRIGHMKKDCRNEKELCSKCSESKHQGSCNGPLYCINCRGEHSSKDRNCWVYKERLKRLIARQTNG